ncbi:DHH family phosphoesterase [Haloplasma contractile]|uniref:tRNA nucleotidyltransferase CCA-adding enzyme protein n=1 Tax=Haloplasma contractile SSD-17B TaxID=1033810 RepID=U2FKL1_9MOLU|nr:DHH family phosphoesterase [Haloplasma contractile]ERJ13340.1 tRNA nucleotidyltransferase CCA-adding enzyme protein [Haloplasma contractile SSD-17B]
MEQYLNRKMMLLILPYLFLIVVLVAAIIDPSTILMIVLTILVLTTIAMHITFYIKFYTHENKTKEISDLTYRVKKIGAHAFNRFPIAIISYTDDHKVDWANFNAKSIFGEKIAKKHLNKICPSLYEKLSATDYTAEIHEQIYDVVNYHDKRLLYLVNVTSRQAAINEFYAKRLAVGYLNIDNYEDAVSELNEQKRSILNGTLNTFVMGWAKSEQIYAKSYSDAKYMLVLEYQKLLDVMHKKFEVLNRIKRISDKFDVTLTLSIGIACNEHNPYQMSEKALEILDLTQNRGGDQAAVQIDDQDIRFFGGKSNMVEKRNKVRARVVATELDELIEDASNVIVMPHKIPDTDAFGAATGVLNIVNRKGKDCFIVDDIRERDKTLDKVFSYLQENDSNILRSVVTPQIAMEICNKHTLLIVVDTQNPDLVVEQKLLSKAGTLVVIDHHRRGKRYIESPDLIYTETYASSTAELITEIIEYYPQKVVIPDITATCMLAGIVVDTNNFTYRTGSRTFDAASYLRKHGANTLEVQTMLRESYEEHLIRAELFEKVELTPYDMAIVVAEDMEDLTKIKLAQTADWLLMIENVKASFVIGKIEGNVVGISSRSFGEVNVQLIMEKLGGGGHLNNAATQLENITPFEARNLLVAKIEEYIEEVGNNEGHTT